MLYLLGAPPSGPLCDFCSSTPVYKSYAAEDFVVDKGETALISESKGAWAACERCAKLIDAEDWPGLTKYSIQTFAKHNGLPERVVTVMLGDDLKRLHDLFRAHKRMES